MRAEAEFFGPARRGGVLQRNMEKDCNNYHNAGSPG